MSGERCGSATLTNREMREQGRTTDNCQLSTVNYLLPLEGNCCEIWKICGILKDFYERNTI
ncbi:hypothetical protein NSMS1_41520 [Nostoc sp. MS1]|nr:hypothetical protein NSMS1_41520 [Nostoc sp. MS1]